MRFLIIHIAFLALAPPLLGQDMVMLTDLRGGWRFEIGDDTAWAAPAFDDGGWDLIQVPAYWEDEGYPGYDGWAWYRTRFSVAEKLRFEALYLHLGNVDDVDEVYLNGRLVAFSGSPPPHYITAYAEQRWYYLPYEYLRFDGPNVLAVRVYDNEMGGGIIRGRIGIYRQRNYLAPDQSLRGVWKLRLGDLQEWKNPDYDDSAWLDALVPAWWETQGAGSYDGFGWYRRTFTLDPALRGERLILLLGKIDDVDEVWLNGRRVGSTGRMPEDGGYYMGSESYLQLRAYYLPADILDPTGTNTIAVRVYDGWLHGGMYQGPVGLVRQERYRAWSRGRERREKGGLDRLMDAIFGK